jgi:thymidine phosphorylase
VVTAIDAESIGLAGVWLGAGRRAKEDAVDPAAGLVLGARVGERVERGQPLAELHHGAALPADRVAAARRLVAGAFTVDAAAPPAHPARRVIEVLR